MVRPIWIFCVSFTFLSSNVIRSEAPGILEIHSQDLSSAVLRTVVSHFQVPQHGRRIPSCKWGDCSCSRTTGVSPTCSRSTCQPRSLRMLGGEMATHYAGTKWTSHTETLKPRYALWYLKIGSKMLQDCSKQCQAKHQDVVHWFYLKTLCWLKTSCQHWLKQSA